MRLAERVAVQHQPVRDTVIGIQGGRQLGPRVDPELLVDVAQVILDRLRTEEQLARGRPGGEALTEQQRDLDLLRGELIKRADVPPAS